MTKTGQDKIKQQHHTSLPAKLISFEGIDGCGKSTLMDKLSTWLEHAGIPYIMTREPGGTPIGEKVREILLDPALVEMSSRAEVLLYSASRAQLVEQVIVPAIKNGVWVLTDRFIDATFAYQGYGRGFDLERLRIIQEWTTRGVWPDKTVLLDCDIDTALTRLDGRDGKNRDRIEQEDRVFHTKVRNGYLALAEKEPQRFIVLDASKPLEEVIDGFYEKFWLSEVGL